MVPCLGGLRDDLLDVEVVGRAPEELAPGRMADHVHERVLHRGHHALGHPLPPMRKDECTDATTQSSSLQHAVVVVELTRRARC